MMLFVCEVIYLIHLLKLLFNIMSTTCCAMKIDKYASKLNSTIIFVKGYNASVRMQIEKMPNAPSFCSSPPYHQRITPNHSSINRLL